MFSIIHSFVVYVANRNLWEAASKGNVYLIMAALKAGADIGCLGSGTPEEQGLYYWPCTPLHVACGLGHKDAVKLLLSKGADLHGTESYGWTALFFAARGGKSKVISLLLNEGANIDALDGNGRTALTWAVLYGRVGAVRMLLGRGADPDIDPSLTDDNVLRKAGMWRQACTSQKTKKDIWRMFKEAREFRKKMKAMAERRNMKRIYEAKNCMPVYTGH